MVDVIRISVVVPFQDAEPYIERCIEGLISQTYPVAEYEIIMVDNGAADGSGEIVRRHPRVRALSEAKRGAYAARNRGIEAARGEIVAFTDADCVPSPDWLAEIATAMEDPDVSIVLGHTEPGGSSRPLTMLTAYEHAKHEWVFGGTARELYFGHAGNMAVRKSLFEELGPFLERSRGSDTVLVRNCAALHSGDAVRYRPEMRVRHLEVDGLWKHYRKLSTYGASSRRYSRIVGGRTLSDRERVRVFRNVVRNERLSWADSTRLLGVLACGRLAWAAGRLRAARNGRGEGRGAA